jgi:hypothetical protein
MASVMSCESVHRVEGMGLRYRATPPSGETLRYTLS